MYLLSILFGFVFLCACNNNEDQGLLIDKEDVFDPPTEIQFVYQGKEYYSSCEYVDDEMYIVDDAVRVVYETLCDNPYLSTVIRGDDPVAYFDNYDDVIKTYDLQQEEYKPATKAVMIFKAEIELYEDTKYRKHMGTYQTLSRHTLPVLGKQKKLSSFKLRHYQHEEGNLNPVLLPQESYVTFYDGQSYTGKNITFINPAFPAPGLPGNPATSTLSIPYLKKHSRGSKNWNDAVCSLIFGFRRVP